MLEIEQELIAQQYIYCGVDEAGAGPLCGDVVAAAVILDPARPIAELNDSKKLSEKKREYLFDIIKENALSWCIARATPQEIDEINILHARMLAMSRAIAGLHIPPQHALIDGNRLPKHLMCPATAIVKGDALVASISAASILAKVQRDREMQVLDQEFPQYGFAKHKGYPTAAHLAALQEHGPNHLYRKSYGPVKALLKIG